MSILEKLKDLVASMDESRTEKEIVEDLSNILTEEDEQQEELEEIEEIPDYLECTEEETSLITSLLEKEKAIKIKLAEKVLEFEKMKQIANLELSKNRSQIMSSLNNLRLEYGVPEEGYVVQLPSSPEDKVSFKKE